MRNNHSTTFDDESLVISPQNLHWLEKNRKEINGKIQKYSNKIQKIPKIFQNFKNIHVESLNWVE